MFIATSILRILCMFGEGYVSCQVTNGILVDVISLRESLGRKIGKEIGWHGNPQADCGAKAWAFSRHSLGTFNWWSRIQTVSILWLNNPARKIIFILYMCRWLSHETWWVGVPGWMTYISNFASYEDVTVKPMAVVTSVGLGDTVTGLYISPAMGQSRWSHRAWWPFVSHCWPRLIWRSKPLESPWKAHQK